MHRCVVLLALVGCDPPAPGPEPPAPPRWVYAPPPTAWPLGEVRGRIGRGQAPQQGLVAGITGPQAAPLRLVTLFAVPGDGAARAIAYGLEGAQPAVELIEVDAGRVVWRETKTCSGPVVGVTESAIVCADADGLRTLGLDGKPRWRNTGTFLAVTDDRIALAGAGEVIVIGTEDGEELAHVKLPVGIAAESIVATCGDAGRELFANGRDGKLARIAEVKGKPAVTWSAPVGGIAAIDPCGGASLLVQVSVGDATSLIALDRATGKQTGRVDGVRGWWKARDGGPRIEVSTAGGVTVYARDLVAAEATGLPPLGELLGARGDRRFVRASPLTAVVLDPRGVRAHLAFGAMGGVLGDQAIVGASWVGSPGETVHRLGLPPPWRRAILRLPRRVGVALPAELRDLPAPAVLDLAAAIAKPDTAMHDVRAAVLDRGDATLLYAVTLERPASDAVAAGVASVDLARRAWRWQRSDGCGPGTPVGLAVARDVVVCASRTTSPRAASVRATSRDGVSRWEWEGDNADGVQAAGDTVVVHDASRLEVLDAATGHLRARIASADGAAVPAALVAIESPGSAGARSDAERRGESIDDATYLVTAERGRLVARLPSAGVIPVWSLAIDGAVRSIAASAAGVLVELEDGDAYRVDLRTATATALPGLGLDWRASGDLVTGTTASGPIPGPPPSPPPPPRFVLRPPPPRPVFRGREPDPEPPKLWTPIAPPPSLGDSWQYTLYELTGALRARNDYALVPPIVPAPARGPAGSPLVVASGPGLREVLVLDPRTGDPVKRVQLPDAAAHGLVFGTVVDGTPVAGALLAAPLRVVLF